MMSKSGTLRAGRASAGDGKVPPNAQIELSEEDRSKDAFFVQLADIAEAMIARHGKDFAMGTLVLTARFIAEDKPLTKPAVNHS
ncbi:hypothetical protein FNL55_24385 [Tardiphaga sp. vice352]|uniref:hypothetical protein n=1 Tax=unclassified Tardiphaga TaxID=2631404 RepID=UPI00116366B9|nr:MULTISPECIES: hypothetical protein [unclassified Tardiphaga]MBC7583368.1 hypothetical protein [Tardiphaga sp.]QDM18833.1 hypothetical protein FNL53_24925 [Tardiphaga sp. vice278]QDM23826.1 hypothetical protein FIU28_23695 [Tardiphaga sp. vice154]QDM29050.1 hypothetical protein FNL56_25145 [Tardiphaga sp. vice304]QDM34149.1 hypothetical protein FNL55_24385 [Tardiphaga sp. vice352]